VTEDREIALVDSAMKLFSVEINDLYAVLGMQLLACEKPTRAAGIVTFLSAIRQANRAVNFIDIVRPELIERGEWFDVVHEELKRDGVRYLADMSGELRKALGNEEILRLSDHLSPSNLHVIIMLVGAALKVSTQFDSICATVAVLLIKNGLRDLCA